MSRHSSVLAEGSMSQPTHKTSTTAEAGSRKSHYRPLPKQFWRDGFNYQLLAREGDGAIYKQTWHDCPDRAPCYEVIRIRQRAAFCIGDRFVEPAEVYPNSKAWGTDAFTLTDQDTAFAKLRLLRSGL